MTDQHGKKAAGRFASLGWRSAVVAGAAAAIGVVASVALSDPAQQGARYAVGESQAGTAIAEQDPLRTELARCRTIATTTDDARCRAAWEVNRRRFMGESRSFVVPDDPTARGPSVPVPALPSSDSPTAER